MAKKTDYPVFEPFNPLDKRHLFHKDIIEKLYIDGKELKKWNSKELSKKLSILKQSNNLNIKNLKINYV